MSNIILSLQITLFGMVLIFGVMVLLWTLLSLMVFLLARVEKSSIQDEDKSNHEDDSEELIRQQAVAVAISAALHQRISTGPGRFPLPPTAFVSAWQAVLRSHILNKRGAFR